MKAELLNFKKLVIKPNAHINGGFLSYNADDQTGVITYQGELDAVIGISKALPFSGTTKVDPSELLSANIKVGQTLNLPGFNLKIVSIDAAKATADVSYENGGIVAKGSAIIDLSEKTISIKSIHATGTVTIVFFPVTVILEAESV